MDHIAHTFAELFCGPGGMSSGFLAKSRMVTPNFPGFLVRNRELHHFNAVWALDNNPDAVATYAGNHPGVEVVCADAETFDFSTAPDVEGLLFGFPCNDFSAAGPRTGLEGEYGALFREGLRFIEQKNVDWWVAENVGGLRSDAGGDTIRMMLDVMAECGAGYRVTAHFYHMEEYFVPQKRHRVIIVGIADRLGRAFRVPVPNSYRSSVESAVAGIPEGCPNHEMPRHTQDVKNRLALIPEGKNIWYLEEIERQWARRLEIKEDPELRQQLEHLRRLMRKKTDVKHSYIYRRLRHDRPAYTVTGSGGGGTHMYHWKENRTMTNRERARIQTFADDFVFHGSTDSVRRQIGMAVPPYFAAVMAQFVAKTLGGEEYYCIPANIREP